ncbi:MAG: hypothetical protein F7B06_05180 [Opitutae bacterium]|nr:hypothetical protein [Opitutae bacterium]MBC9889239.1 hypothetical protein [Opitutae bacterium]
MKHYVNLALLFAFGVLVTSGLLRFFEPFSLITTRVHIVFGILVLVLVALHLSSRLDYFWKILLRKKKASRARPKPVQLLLLPGLTCSYLLSASLLEWWPVPQLLSLGHEVKNSRIIFRPEDGAAIRPLDGRIQVKRQASAEASVLVEIEWGPAFDPAAEFPVPFAGARPQIAVWAESSSGSLIETFFVSEESAFAESIEWAGQERRRVDILPIWRHQFTLASGVAPDGGMDTYSGATPEHSFSIERYIDEDPEGFYLSVEVNAPNDPNDFYHADQPGTNEGYTFPGVGQPSIYYSAYIDPTELKKYYLMEFVGHGGSNSQQSGNIYYDSSHLTTAGELIEKILVRIERP